MIGPAILRSVIMIKKRLVPLLVTIITCFDEVKNQSKKELNYKVPALIKFLVIKRCTKISCGPSYINTFANKTMILKTLRKVLRCTLCTMILVQKWS